MATIPASILPNVRAIAVITTGCGPLPNPPLVFGQTHSVGITITSSAVEQGCEYTLGYRDRDLAIVPVSLTKGGGSIRQLETHGFNKESSQTDNPDKDTFAVLGQLELRADGAEAMVGLGKFFATGLAARRLAKRSACALSVGKWAGCMPQIASETLMARNQAFHPDSVATNKLRSCYAT